MKHRDLTNRLREMGYWLKQNKGPHEKWTNGPQTVAVPRHKEINEITALKILKKAQERKI